MSANLNDRFLDHAATLIDRQKTVVARRKAEGRDSALAESLLAEMEKSERLLRSQSALARSAVAASRLSTARRMLDPAFLSSIAQELRNYLQSLKLDLYSTQRSCQRGSAAELSAVQDIEVGLSMMNLLSQDLLIASQMQSGNVGSHLRSRSVARLLLEAMQILQPIASLSGVHLHIVPVSQPLQVRCDRERMLHAITSLAIEVVKGTRRGGRISLSARRSGDAVTFALATDAARFRRAPGSSKSFRAWLARALIEAQGGRVWSGKAVGRDGHLYFAMPTTIHGAFTQRRQDADHPGRRSR